MNIGNQIALPRFLLFLVLLIGGFAVGSLFLPRGQAVMVGFDLAATTFLLACVPLLRGHAKDMRKSARENDANRVMLLILTTILSWVILVNVAGELVGPGHPPPAEKLLIVMTLVIAWTFANVVYALHYAHLFYTGDKDGKDRAGLIFPGNQSEPNYSDFIYFSFTIGVALQTSDVAITSPSLRRVVIGQSVVAFLYNLVVLALAVSVLGAR